MTPLNNVILEPGFYSDLFDQTRENDHVSCASMVHRTVKPLKL